MRCLGYGEHGERLYGAERSGEAAVVDWSEATMRDHRARAWSGASKKGVHAALRGASQRFSRDRKSTRLNSSHRSLSRMPSSA